MKRFMEKNEVTYNLMSFSGFKAILLFSYLLSGPKSYKDIENYLLKQEFLNESASIDTIRIYINSLRKIGCNVVRKVKKKISYFYIENHPFELKITDEQAKSILKVYMALSANIDLDDFYALQSFFVKIEPYITNEDFKKKIKNASPLKSINQDIMHKLLECVKNKYELCVEYKSPASGSKKIYIAADKLFILNKKLYIAGINSEHDNYGNLLVEKIIKIVDINPNATKLKIQQPINVIYELALERKGAFIPESDEKIIKEDENTVTVEVNSNNKFFVTQRILSFAGRCKVISPDEYKEEIISHLKKMKEGYLG